MVFGRRTQTAGTEPPVATRESLDVCSEADVEWIKQTGNPLVWHDAALACLIFSGDPHRLLPWLAEQTQLDRVTAAAMFLHNGNGAAHLSGAALQCHVVDPETTSAMLERLCSSHPTPHFQENGIGLSQGWEDARLDTVANLPEAHRAAHAILRGPINVQTARMPYQDIGEGELMSRAYLEKAMPFLLD